jgi:hypothetical protein
VSDLSLDTPPTRPRRSRADDRPVISLPNGKELYPRRQWSKDKGVTERTAKRMNLPTTYISNVAYVLEPDSTEQLAAGVRRQQPVPRRRVRR